MRNIVMNVITFPENLLTTSGLSISRHGVILLQDATSYDQVKQPALAFSDKMISKLERTLRAILQNKDPT